MVSWADGIILVLGQGLANFFYKAPDSKYFMFGRPHRIMVESSPRTPFFLQPLKI